MRIIFSKNQLLTLIISLAISVTSIIIVYSNNYTLLTITSRFIENLIYHVTDKPDNTTDLNTIIDSKDALNPSNSIIFLEKQIETSPNNPKLYYLLGKLYELTEFTEGKYYKKMEYYYSKYLQLEPVGPTSDDVKLRLAQYYIQLGLTQDKVNYLDQALHLLSTLDQNNNEVKMALGAIYLDKKNYDKAINSFAGSVNVDPSELKLKYNSLGLAYIKKSDYKSAKNMLEIAVKIDPSDKYAHNNLGFVYLRSGNYSDAKDEFVKALEIDPLYKKAKKNLNHVQIKLN